MTREQHRVIQTKLTERCVDLNQQFEVSMPKAEEEDSPSRVMDEEEFIKLKLKLGTIRVDHMVGSE